MLCKRHHGILCGACTAGYGKARRGDCIKCGNRVKAVIYSCLLAIFYGGLVAFMSRQALSLPREGNCCQGEDSTTKDARSEIEDNMLGESRSLLVGQSSSDLATSQDTDAPQLVKPSGRPKTIGERSTSKGKSFASDILKVKGMFRACLTQFSQWYAWPMSMTC